MSLLLSPVPCAAPWRCSLVPDAETRPRREIEGQFDDKEDLIALFGTGIRIEDDGNTVRDNLFVGDFEYLYLGSPFRAKMLNRPIEGTVIEGNKNASPSSRSFLQNSFLADDEHKDTVIGQPDAGSSVPVPDTCKTGQT